MVRVWQQFLPKDTLKLADEALFAKETLKRSEVWNIQTPQVLRILIF